MKFKVNQQTRTVTAGFEQGTDSAKMISFFDRYENLIDWYAPFSHDFEVNRSKVIKLAMNESLIGVYGNWGKSRAFTSFGLVVKVKNATHHR